jgi:hypothetical protein
VDNSESIGEKFDELFLSAFFALRSINPIAMVDVDAPKALDKAGSDGRNDRGRFP